MPNFRRYYVPNAIVFITAVTANRIPYFQREDDIVLFWQTLREAQRHHPFRLLAYVLLPDHFHWLMRVEREDGNFSDAMHSIKRNCTLNYKRAHSITRPFSLWQSRFWDHVIRNEEDLERHFDYVHWNPVKHGYVGRPGEWRDSTFAHWLERGYYEADWAAQDEPAYIAQMDYE